MESNYQHRSTANKIWSKYELIIPDTKKTMIAGGWNESILRNFENLTQSFTSSGLLKL